MNNLLQLLKKDWRLNRGPIIGFLLIVVISVPLYGLHVWAPYNILHGTTAASYVILVLAFPPLTAFYFAAVMAAFGGCAFAVERRNRSAEFLAMLPVQRSRIMFSKLIICFIWLFILIALEPVLFGHFWFDFSGLILWTSVAISAFGIAWLFSTFLNSAAISSAIAITITLFSTILVAALARSNSNLGSIGEINCAIGLAALVAGYVHYLFRIPP